MNYIELRKNLNLTLKQFKTKIAILNIDFKDDYSDDEIEKITSFVNSKLNKADLRDLPYVNQGWIPLRKLLEEIDISNGTLMSYVKLLNIEIYKPIHQLSFISKDDREKILNFINEHKDSKERKIYLSEQTCLKKFGVINGAKDEKVRKQLKTLATNNSKERLEKSRKTNLIKYGVENPFELWDSSEYWNSLSDEEKQIRNKKISDSKTKYRFIESDKIYICDLAQLLNEDYSGVNKAMINLNIHHKEGGHVFIYKDELPKIQEYYKLTEMSGISYAEKELSDFVKSICKEQIIENSKNIISPYELDIYIPSKNLAIEFDGLYWHNELNKDRNYHLNKTNDCNALGIDLIHIFEDDWKFKKDIIKSIISSRLGIYKEKFMARKCELRKTDKLVAKEFLNNNHIQGYARCDKFYGLYFDGELLQLVGINSKGFHDGNVELTRMGIKLNTQVVGGFSKLMKFIYDEYKSPITSYVNKSMFNGKGYESIGFKIIKDNPPTYWWIVNNKRVHRSYFQKSKIKKLYENGKLSYWNETESESENMKHNNIHKIYDCGTVKISYNS